ncbi:uncharacterized protein LOC124138319 [Haliotis rufescens]|uniref:uncharacterized protein LOC124138319 n=1 Tax=Haliotis rufescens TaxID=6454 RepID=UPI00201FA2FB|nr:uncharacterized protein LOC124138319 [Haliotis rufescens]
MGDRDLKTYVHCLTTELHGCVGESEERTSLQALADAHYVTILYRCDYFGANGICDVGDCTFVADVSKGYTKKSCDEMAMYINCLNIELWECGPKTLYGTQVESQVDSLMLDSELFCGSTKAGVIPVMALILLTLAVYVT